MLNYKLTHFYNKTADTIIISIVSINNYFKIKFQEALKPLFFMFFN